MNSTDKKSKDSNIISYLPENWDYQADVIVVGYGGAGACAAIAANDVGSSVLVIEKAPFGGGNTGCCAGGMSIPNDLSNAIEYYRALAQGTADEELTKALAIAMVNLPSILKKLGAGLEYKSHKSTYPIFPGSNSFNQLAFLKRTECEKEKQKAEGEMWGAGGDKLFKFIDNQVRQRNINVMYETPAKALVQDINTKEILGVRAENSQGYIYIKSRKGVVLACGGFENNMEMLVNFLPHAAKLPIYPLGSPYNTGDGISMAAEVGAKLWHMAGCELGNFAPKAPSEKFGVGFRLERQLPIGSQAIYINKYGKRFMNESILLSHRKDHFKIQDFDFDHAEYPNIPLFMIFDETFRKKRPIVATHIGWWCINDLYKWSDDNSTEISLGWILQANTIKGLAEKIRVDADVLLETVCEYNDFCKIGEDCDFGRSKEWLMPIEDPPYYATELCEPIINTQGGPKHNAQAQVLDKNDKPIPRLYAAGELGSFFYPLYQSGSNLPEALAFGIIAGEHASSLSAIE